MHIPHLALGIFEFILTLLITALIGNVIDEAFSGNPSSINYAMFVAVFSWVVVLYGLAAAVLESIAIPIAMMVLNGLAVMFTFIAGVVLAAKLGVHSCGNSGYTNSNSLTNGSHDTSKRCHELQASCAFFWFLFAAYIASLFFSFTGMKSSGTSSRGGGMRKGGPSMSHV